MPFLTKLVAEKVVTNQGNRWQLHEPLVYQLVGAKDITITAPAGFETDFASVPRIPFAYLFFGGEFEEAAVIHDYLYRHGTVTRKVADQILQEAMIESGYEPYYAQYVYYGVRIGGRKIWKQYRSEKK